MESRRLVSVVKPHSRLLALALAAALCESAVALLGPWPLKLLFDGVLGSEPLPHWIQGITGGDKIVTLQLTASLTLLIAIAGAAFAYIEKHYSTTVGQWVAHDLRLTLYFHIQRLGLSYHDRKQTGDLISRVTSDIDSVQTFITSGLLTILIQGLTLTGMIGVMFYMNWRFTLIALSIVPALLFVVFRYTRKIKEFSRDVRKHEGGVIALMEEALGSIRVVKAFAREDYEQQRLEEKSLETVDAALKARDLKAKLTPAVEILVAIGTSVVIWHGGRMALDGTLSPGSLIVFISYLAKMYKPMQELSKTTDTYSKAAVGYERIEEVLDERNDVRDAPGAHRAPRFKGEVEYRNVTFKYDGDRPILNDVSFRIPAGQVAAIVGPTGAGKSTILGLLPRFYDPESGAVLIDGHNVRSFKQKSLRDQISFVLQETTLFHGAIWENIAYGKPGASRADILRAAALANVHEFAENMPDGYDTIVGERGATLSGGQRQRIAIARAIIRDTPILLLDEPSSGLDAASERLVFDALERLMAHRTTIVVAHRFSTIRNADVIFAMRDGQIVESGKHEELLVAGGVYAELCHIQFGMESEFSVSNRR